RLPGRRPHPHRADPPHPGAEVTTTPETEPWTRWATTSTALFTLHVHGRPAPHGSKKAFAHSVTGKIITQEMSKYVRPWRQDRPEERRGGKEASAQRPAAEPTMAQR